MPDTAELTLPDPASAPETYRDDLIAILGDNDPIDIIAATPTRIRDLLTGHTLETLIRRPAPDQWSAAEIIGHLLDDEIINGFRLRMVLTAVNPPYPGTDPEAWAQLPKPPLDHLLPAFESLRSYNLHLMHRIPRSRYHRKGLHHEQGPESILTLLQKNAGHDLAHLNQLQRTLAIVSSPPSP